MENLPFYIPLIFVLTTGLAILFFHSAANGRRVVLLVLFFLLAAQAIVARTGFFTVTDTFPPRFVLQVGPTYI